ncbi:MAG: ion transporter [Bacteroidota bacterium]
MSDSNINYIVRLRRKLFIVVFGTNTPAGKLFDVVLLWSIVLSVVSVMLESVKEIKKEYTTLFYAVEWIFTGLFTLEYALRLIITRTPRKYALSFFGVVDLMALLPSYITLFITGGGYLVVIRSIRLLRVFRILKLGRYVKEASVLSNALVASRHKILVFLGAVITLVMIMGTLMYLIEGSESGFTSIPRSIYWAVVTVTTVGYGDIAPQTILGQISASILMLLGYAIIAVPTGIVTSEMVNFDKRQKKKDESKKICSACDQRGHDDDAAYCKRCGSLLSN